MKKVREAQRLGAKAVVVGGEDPDISGFPDTLVNMYSPGGFSKATSKENETSDVARRGLVRYKNIGDIYQVLRLYATLLPHRAVKYDPLRAANIIFAYHCRIFSMGMVFVG